jgi:hypothetical protein
MALSLEASSLELVLRRKRQLQAHLLRSKPATHKALEAGSLSPPERAKPLAMEE